MTLTSFTHIFAGGYFASGYYGCCGAEVLEADAFSLCSARRDFRPRSGPSFRDNILSVQGDHDIR